MIMILLWAPAQYRNLFDPTIDGVALIVAALTGLLITYIAVMLGTMGYRKVRSATQN